MRLLILTLMASTALHSGDSDREALPQSQIAAQTPKSTCGQPSNIAGQSTDNPASVEQACPCSAEDMECPAFGLTYYWVAQEGHGGRRTDPLFGPAPAGKVLYRTTRSFHRSLLMEGSGRTKDGRTLNVTTPCRPGQSHCFRWLRGSNARWGTGADGSPLMPFRSVAVDTDQIALGTPLYAAALDGLPLPHHRRHDGCLIASDVGGRIRGHRVDLFIGDREMQPTFERWLGDDAALRLEPAPSACGYLRRSKR
jgi:3D (Asp-Asp-Asp) domain-containing protein